VFLLVVLTDKIKGIYTIPPQDAKIQITECILINDRKSQALIALLRTPSSSVAVQSFK
jgi:hypothetical protein